MVPQAIAAKLDEMGYRVFPPLQPRWFHKRSQHSAVFLLGDLAPPLQPRWFHKRSQSEREVRAMLSEYRCNLDGSTSDRRRAESKTPGGAIAAATLMVPQAIAGSGFSVSDNGPGRCNLDGSTSDRRWKVVVSGGRDYPLQP